MTLDLRIVKRLYIVQQQKKIGSYHEINMTLSQVNSIKNIYRKCHIFCESMKNMNALEIKGEIKNVTEK